jgi:hypothetical protein
MSTDEPHNQMPPADIPPMKHTNINVPSWQMTVLIDQSADMLRHIHALENHVWHLSLFAKVLTVAVILVTVMVAVAIFVV